MYRFGEAGATAMAQGDAIEILLNKQNVSEISIQTDAANDAGAVLICEISNNHTTWSTVYMTSLTSATYALVANVTGASGFARAPLSITAGWIRFRRTDANAGACNATVNVLTYSA